MAPHDSPSFLSKDAVRLAAFEKRQSLPKAYRDAASLALKDNFLKNVELPAHGGVISAYMPFNSELDPKPLMHHLLDAGYRIVIPTVINNAASLEFRTWTPATPVYKNLHGIEESDERHSEVLLPDLMIVPLIAFDANGNRMGYGSGQFDRSFEHLQQVRQKFFAVGVAFEEQRVDAVPIDMHDFQLHRIVTNLNVYNPPGVKP